MCRDCDYGDYKYIANEKPHWTEIFTLGDEQEKIGEMYWEFLEEAARLCGLDTSDWDREDWWDFEDRISDCRFR